MTKTNVWNYSNEYLGYCENRYGGHVYDWKYDGEKEIVHLEWKLGKYSYDVKKAFEIEAFNILEKYPTVCIEISGMFIKIYRKPQEASKPAPIEPKPPINITINTPINKPKEPPIILEPPKPQEEKKSALQSFVEWFLSIFKR